MKAFACIICGRDKQGAVVCRPCRQANIRLLKYFKPIEVFLIMMFSKIFGSGYV